MIEKVVRAHRDGVISLDDLFVSLARNSGDPNWGRAFALLSEEEQSSFKTWATPLLFGEVAIMQVGGRFAIEESHLHPLRDRAQEAGWLPPLNETEKRLVGAWVLEPRSAILLLANHMMLLASQTCGMWTCPIRPAAGWGASSDVFRVWSLPDEAREKFAVSWWPSTSWHESARILRLTETTLTWDKAGIVVEVTRSTDPQLTGLFKRMNSEDAP